MEQVKFKITKQSIVCNRQSLVSDTQNVYECVFEFDDEWNGYQKWAVFKQDERAYKVLLDNDTCLMPNEAIVNQGYTQIGVYGLTEDRRYPTIWTNPPILVQLGCIDGIYPPAPTPTEWEQALMYMAKIDVLETYIPEGTSEENQLVNTKTLSDELERVEGEIPTKYSDLVNDNHTVQDENYVHTDNNFTTTEKTKLSGLENYDDTEVKQDIEDLDTRLTSAETNISNLDSRLDTAETDIDTIEAKIPSQATSSNQLADKEFVNSSIATSTATFQGTFDVVEDLGLTYEATHLQVETALESIVGSKTNNDYVFVFFTNPTTEIVEKYERYKFTSDDNSWNFEYVLNNSSFTSNQWASINSGITSLLVAQITTNKNDITTINQSLTALANRVGTAETNIANLQTAIGNVYTKSQTYSKSEVDNAINNHHDSTKANADDVYTKDETNTQIINHHDDTKANQTDLTKTNIALVEVAIEAGERWSFVKQIAQTIGTFINFVERTYTKFRNLINEYAISTSLKEIDGRSVVGNQHIKNYNFQSTLYIGENLGTISVANNEATFTSNSSSSSIGMYIRDINNPVIPAGHKALLIVDVKSPTYTGKMRGYVGGGSYVNFDKNINANYQTNSAICVSDGTNITTFYTSDTSPSGTVIVYRKPRCVDLTTWFGQGNEPSDLSDTKIEEVKRYLALHPEYDEGSIVSAEVDKIINKNASDEITDEIDIPQAIQNLDGYSWSAGNVSNNVDYANKKFIKRIARVDLGSLDYALESEYNRFICIQYRGLIKTNDGTVPVNALCSKYIVTSNDDGWIKRNSVTQMCVDTQGSLLFYNTGYTTAQEFKNAMNGNYLYYELPTPIEIDISSYLPEYFGQFNVEGNGTITIHNNNELDTTSKFENMEVIQ